VKSVKERFDSKWMPEPYSGCWIWIGSARNVRPSKRVYGEFVYERKHCLAHRVSWILFKGDIPSNINVLHRCDTTLCVNPNHLFLGTQIDNIADRVLKRRSAIGERHGNAKLTEREVLLIKSEIGSCRKIAARYGIGPTQVLGIKNGRTWRHLW
jgi:hypothetical protein